MLSGDTGAACCRSRYGHHRAVVAKPDKQWHLVDPPWVTEAFLAALQACRSGSVAWQP